MIKLGVNVVNVVNVVKVAGVEPAVRISVRSAFFLNLMIEL